MDSDTRKRKREDEDEEEAPDAKKACLLPASLDPLVLLVYQSDDDYCPKAVLKLIAAIGVGAVKAKGRIMRYSIYEDEIDIVPQIKHVLELNPSVRAILLCLASVKDPVTRRQVNVAADAAPILAKDKSLRVYVCGKPYSCLLPGAGSEMKEPDAPKDLIYGVPELTLGVTGPMQKIICDKLVPWLNAPVVTRKRGTQKLTDMVKGVIVRGE